MKWLLLFFSTFLFCLAQAGNTEVEVSQRCQAPMPTEPGIFSSEFQRYFSFAEMMSKFTQIYKSPQRLPQRAYWDAKTKTLKLPFDKELGGDVKIQNSFIQTIVRHIEKAFELSYVDAVFFPDMGHSHLLVPEAIMNNYYETYPTEKMSSMYEALFSNTEVQILYHTAEKMRMLDASNTALLPDEHIRWRHRTRNIVGQNSPQSHLEVLTDSSTTANVVSERKGFSWWGGGFNISANQNGCFEYKNRGKKYFFDLSLYDLVPESDENVIDQ
ncbi:MAG: hypothetical protein AAGB31_11205 [Bdellovibrio sp.]